MYGRKNPAAPTAIYSDNDGNDVCVCVYVRMRASILRACSHWVEKKKKLKERSIGFLCTKETTTITNVLCVCVRLCVQRSTLQIEWNKKSNRPSTKRLDAWLHLCLTNNKTGESKKHEEEGEEETYKKTHNKQTNKNK